MRKCKKERKKLSSSKTLTIPQGPQEARRFIIKWMNKFNFFLQLFFVPFISLSFLTLFSYVSLFYSNVSHSHYLFLSFSLSLPFYLSLALFSTVYLFIHLSLFPSDCLSLSISFLFLLPYFSPTHSHSPSPPLSLTLSLSSLKVVVKKEKSDVWARNRVTERMNQPDKRKTSLTEKKASWIFQSIHPLRYKI